MDVSWCNCNNFEKKKFLFENGVNIFKKSVYKINVSSPGTYAVSLLCDRLIRLNKSFLLTLFGVIDIDRMRASS